LLLVISDLSRAQRTLSNSLIKFNFECIGTSQTDEEVSISVSLKEFGRLIANIEEQRDMMVSNVPQHNLVLSRAKFNVASS
jgi:hypothetical protein